MKYYLIAGEASGDLHGSNLIRALRNEDSAADIRCWGGDLMEQAGGKLVKHYRELAFMGFVEVIRNLGTILKNLTFCKEDIERHRPDVLVLIDYPGFNLRIARWAHQRGYKVVYYISPQVWAWKESRVKAIKRDVDKMLVILPFEKPFYERWHYQVEYVGHPLVEVVSRYQAPAPLFPGEAVVALLPGSRRQEITAKLPVMLAAASRFPQYRFVVAGAPSIEPSFYQLMLQDFPNASIVYNQTYALLSEAKAALVTSGTATLETALFGVPEVVCYRGSRISYVIAKRLIRIKFISLVNLIMDREVVKELIQDELTADNLQHALDALLHSDAVREKLKADYAALRQLLYPAGNASVNAARSIFRFLLETGNR
jgi:lipid-A-disaccharide synthase